MILYKKNIFVSGSDSFLDIRQLKYFLAVIKEGQITAAAKTLHISQPPLSHQIKLLEDELNVQLFERGSRNIKLTHAGNILRIRAEQIINLIESTSKELKDLGDGLHGTLNIGTVASLGATILPQHIHTFNQKYPNINFRIFEGDSFKVMKLLNDNIVEIGILRTPFNSSIYEYMLQPGNISSDPMIAVGNSKWSWEDIKNLNSISLLNIKDTPLIIHQRYEKRILDSCRRFGFKPNIFCTSDDIRSMLTWACNGLGVAIVPKSTICLVKTRDLKFKEINDPLLETKVALIWLKSHYLSTIAHHFIDNFKSYNEWYNY